MNLSALTFIGGVITLAWAATGFFLMWTTHGEKIFTENRPFWLGLLCWAYMTLALLAWAGFVRTARPTNYLAAGIVTLTAAKFIFFYISYGQWRAAFIALWKRRGIFAIVLGSGTVVGALMLFIAWLIS